MPFNLLLLPLIGGYFFLTYWNFTKFDTKRYSGHRLIFHAAAAGLVFLVIAFAVTRFIADYFPSPPHHGVILSLSSMPEPRFSRCCLA